MRARASIIGPATALALGLGSWTAYAAPSLRVQVTQRGDFVLLGNTLGHECDPNANVPAPIVGTVGACGTLANPDDSAPDVFWRSDSPMLGQAEANTGISAANARSTAVLAIPAGATITHAFIYWSARRQNGGADMQVTLDGPGGPIGVLAADTSFTANANGANFYQAGADVTSLVQNAGEGPYRVGGVAADDIINTNNSNNYAAWWMVVFYQLNGDPPRNLALFEGLDRVQNGNPQNTSISGFLVPNAGFDAKLGVVTFEGDNSLTGDQLFFNDNMNALFDASNPADNFFNGSRTFLGAPVTVVGDLPQLTGAPASMSGLDLDVVDVTAKLSAGATTATIRATSSQDLYLLGGWVTSISTYVPDFSTSTKTAVDLNGGNLVPGDTIEYTIVVTNTGNDDSINTVLTDALPPGVTYVPGTLQITMGANAGAKTDAADGDQGEYTAANRTITVRLGMGADGANGGTMAIGESATLKFRVTLDPGVSGIISNQAVINAGGALGAPATDTPTDGNGGGAGSPPTDVVVQCNSNADCLSPTPICDVTQSPRVCVECYLDAHCPGTTPTCDLGSLTCVCVASGPEICDTIDNDCDGTIDPGCADTDGDGLPDDLEIAIGTDPNDADSDDDGVPDGMEPLFGVDSDGDGLINALDPDSDNDGLFDGTEMGLGCNGPGTDASAGNCRPDGDMGATVTDPLNRDTDGGGASDGSEDWNLNGVIDPGETDPTAGHGADDSSVVDSDGDGLGDDLEVALGSDPNDADTDDDGVIDGLEPNLSIDTDGDGLINVLDPDSDNDALFDGTEMGFGCSDPATDPAAGNCTPDGDAGESTTSPINRDTDGGGVSDGSEDFNLNGVVDAGETDPTAGNGADDSTVVDTDGDGLSDGLEATLGTDPNDQDSDDDGVIDGLEPNPSADTDGDGVINALDPDSDGDGLFDGTEMGFGCDNGDTDVSAGNCIPDGDSGATTTSPLDPDTDHGGVSDGDEDANHNGVVDRGETDPNDGSDDMVPQTCTEDSECGDATSGMICGDEGVCIPGCRGTNGNGCPDGQICTSTDDTPGTCMDGSGGAGGGGGNGPEPESVFVEGGGCLCATGPGSDDNRGNAAWLAGAALAALLGRRRRRQ